MSKRSRINNIYHRMKDRCYYPKNPDFQNWGGRGIKVCDEWRNSYKAFKDWAFSNGYSDTTQLDRINNDGDYTPDNCHFVSRSENCRNRRSNIQITYKGGTKTLIEWCEELGLKYHTTKNRIRRYNWSPEQAFELPRCTRISMNRGYGIPKSEETKKKLSLANKGVKKGPYPPRTEQHRKNLSAAIRESYRRKALAAKDNTPGTTQDLPF